VCSSIRRGRRGGVRTRIDWKYALGLDLADPGFDHSVLGEFRARVADGGLDQVVLDTLLERLAAGGLVGAGGKMRTDSTHVISAVRDLNRLELAGESVRACLEALAVAAPQVVAQLLDDSWGTRYGARIDTWRMPASQTKKAQLALAYGRDGHTLLNAVLVQWAGGAGPAGGSELQGRVDALRDCPAHEVAGFGPVADVVAGEPGVEVGLATGGQGESTGAQPAEQAEGGTHSLADHIELFRYYIEYLSPTGAAPRRRATAARRPPVAATETRGRP
jgi:hypothetical protein